MCGNTGISFLSAARIFEGPVIKFRSDRDGEVRWKAIGVVNGREITVIFTERDETVRIISALRSRINERKEYRAVYPG